MRKNAIAFVLMLSIGLLATSGTFAAVDDNDKPIVSVTPYIGYGFWSEDLGLDDSFMFGARGAFHILNWLSLEGTYGRSGSDRKLDGVSVDLDHYGVDLVAELLPSAKFVPYVTAGWAQLDYNADGADRKLPLNGGEIGIGVKTRLGGNNANYRALRFDIRDVMTNLNSDFPNENSTTHNIIATLGVQFAFGKSSKDGDNDGIRDRDDDCPDTPAGALIDAAGCPTDSDGDGIPDGIDSCSDTPAGATVGPDGCPLDSDGDGVYDGLDKCPDTGADGEVDTDGCPIPDPVVEFEVLNTNDITSSQISFGLDSAVADGGHDSFLEGIGSALSGWRDMKVEIAGHADDTGSEAYNQKLSEERAMSVMETLKTDYPDIQDDQCRVVGYGESRPIADNTTEEGRAANRRVEFKVLNAEELKREIEKR
ncbi:MAG: OmpA family protein [Candidatus Krumholzibacteria bacterium]|nr:OmpA family protein [Candidatus Krumholzibacteria bacterium]